MEKEAIVKEARGLIDSLGEHYDNEDEYFNKVDKVLEKWKEAQDMDELTPFTPEEVAEILRISPVTIKDWLRQGRIRGVKIGKEWRVFKKDLEAYLKQINGNSKK